MLRVNQLSGFGGGAQVGLLVSNGFDSNTNTPSFTVDLGPPGLKQVVAVFACNDISGNDPWDWGTGSVGGVPFSYVVPAGEETAGNGSNFTGGVTIRAVETVLGGEQTVQIPIVGFVATMTNIRMMALVLRGLSSVTPISYDGGHNQGASDGNNFTISTVGARLVVGGAVAKSAPGNLQGPGSPHTEVSSSLISFGYDLSPAGTAGNVYSFTGSKYGIAGAAFG